MAGDAEAHSIEQAADVGEAAVGGEIVLAEMGAVASGFECEAGVVVQQEGDAAGLCDGAQGIDGAAQLVRRCVLEAELDAGDRPGIQRRRQRIGEIGADAWRRDEVERGQALPW